MKILLYILHYKSDKIRKRSMDLVKGREFITREEEGGRRGRWFLFSSLCLQMNLPEKYYGWRIEWDKQQSRDRTNASHPFTKHSGSRSCKTDITYWQLFMPIFRDELNEEGSAGWEANEFLLQLSPYEGKSWLYC